MLLRNKPWEYRDFVNEDTEKFIIQRWHDHFNNPSVEFIGYGFFIIVALGILTFKRQRWFVISLAVMSFLVLANQAPISREFNILFRKIDIVNQVLRDPFTKFLVPSIFLFAVGFSGGLLMLHRLLPARLKKPFSLIGALVLSIGLFIYIAPMYSGHLIADRMRVAIPSSYFEFFAFMNQQPSLKRVANLPQGPVWGWASYTWGYTGSGFLWHGMRQPLLDRTFDVWNEKEESYYWELTYALNKKDYKLFHNVLEKYQVSYVMFDSSIYFPDNPNSIFGTLRQREFIAKDPDLKKIKSFGSIDLYETKQPALNEVSLVENAPLIATTTNWLQNDKAYADYGIYQDGSATNSQIVYPFRSLFSGRGSKDALYEVKTTDNAFWFHTIIPNGTIFFPQETAEEFIRFDAQTLKPIQSLPHVLNNDAYIAVASPSSVKQGELAVVIEKDNRYGSYDSNGQHDILLGFTAECDSGGLDTTKQLSQTTQSESDKKFIRFSAINAITCRVIYFPQLSHRSGYLVAIKSRNKSGSTLRFWVENLTSKRSDQQMYLQPQSSFGWEYYVIPVMEEDGVGYSLHFDNIAIGKQHTVNDLEQVIVYPIPYQFMTETKILTQEFLPITRMNNNALLSLKHPNYYSYLVALDNKHVAMNLTLVLSQSYNSAWKAYAVDGWLAQTFPILFGRALPNHVMINNWANGWVLPELKEQKPVKVQIIFVPQLLEWVGFGLLVIPFIYLAMRRKRLKKDEK